MGKKHGADEARVGGHGDGVGSSGSLPPRFVTSGDGECGENEPGADDESESDWIITVSASAESLPSLSDAFSSFKYDACGLCFILENHEVHPLPVYYPQYSPVPQHTKANMYQGRFFSAATATRLLTTTPRCLWPRIQHPDKLFSRPDRVGKTKTRVSLINQKAAPRFSSQGFGFLAHLPYLRVG